MFPLIIQLLDSLTPCNQLPLQLRLELLTLPLPNFWKCLKAILFTSGSPDLGREHLRISEWRYVNVQFQLQSYQFTCNSYNIFEAKILG